MSYGFLNRVGFETSTTGTDPVSIGAALDGHCTPAEAGAENGATYLWCAEDGTDFEIFEGEYSSSGPSISRGNVLLSKISGNAGTSKMSFSGTAVVRCVASAEVFAAENITYDPSTSSLPATNMQEAVDELAASTGDGLANVVTPQMFGDIGIGADRAAIADALDYAASNPGTSVVIPADTYVFETGEWLEIPSHTRVEICAGARIENTITGADTGIFGILAGSESISIVGLGQLVGPYETTTPSPSLDANSDYLAANGCIRILGNVRNPARDIHIDGPEIIGWGLFGVFAEQVRGGGVYGGTRIRRCGRDGIRMYGAMDWRVGYGLHIEDITPGLGGSAPLLNAYGVTATKRATRTTRFSNFDDFSSVWTLSQIASVGSPIDGSAPGALLQKITPNTSDAVHDIRQTVSGVTPDQTWTCSFEAKADGYSYLRISVRQDAGSNGCRANYDLTNGSVLVAGDVGAGGAFVDARVEDLGDGIYRCILVGNPPSGESGVHVRVQVLSTASTSLTNAENFAGDGTSGVLLGEAQLIEGARDWFARAIRQNPPTDTCHIIGGTVRGVPTWKGLDTHGGRNLFFEDWVIRDCAFAVGIDEGDTVGLEDAPPLNIYVDGIDAELGSAETGGSFINISSSSATNLGSNINIGPLCRGVGFGGTNRGAITVAFAEDFSINNPQVIDSSRPALWVHAGPTSGTVRLRARNCAAGPAMIVVNTTQANILFEGGRLRQGGSFGAISDFSVPGQDSGYEVTVVSSAWKLEGSVS